MSTWKNESLRGKAKSLAKNQEEQKQVTVVLGQTVSQHAERLKALEELVRALCTTVGMEQIQEAVRAQRAADGEARVAYETQQLETGVQAGYITPIDIVDENSLVAVLEHDKDGNLCYYGPQQQHYQNLSPEAQQLLLGKSVGYKTTTSFGNQYELVGAYHVDREKAKVYFEEQQKLAAEKAAQAAATEGAGGAPHPTIPDDLPADIQSAALEAAEVGAGA